MNFTRLAVITIILCLTSVVTYSQCSIVSLEAPADVIAGDSIKITANLSSKASTEVPTFKWTTSAGTITSVQNTSSITIDTAGLGGISIKITVDVGGVVSPCSTNASTEIRVFSEPACGIAFDQYGDLKYQDEKARLDNFAIQLINNQGYFGHIVASAGRRTYPNEASDRLTRAKNYLVKVRKIDPNRIIVVDDGYTEELTVTMWILPGGTPTLIGLRTRIPRDQVDFTKRRPRSPNKRTRPD